MVKPKAIMVPFRHVPIISTKYSKGSGKANIISHIHHISNAIDAISKSNGIYYWFNIRDNQ